MAIASQLRKYKKEDIFIGQFLIPLLRRMGFQISNYHGTSEHGKDLILAEFDRFGDTRFHGVQVKYEGSIGQGASVRSIIDDCVQAFETPFKHPQSGKEERISTFYTINAGSISLVAKERYFNSLRPRYGDNAKLIDGEEIVGLDRWAAFNSQQQIGPSLAALANELRINNEKYENIYETLNPSTRIESVKPSSAIGKLRTIAIEAYLVKHLVGVRLPLESIELYHDVIVEINSLIDEYVRSSDGLQKIAIANKITRPREKFNEATSVLTGVIDDTIYDLKPFGGM